MKQLIAPIALSSLVTLSAPSLAFQPLVTDDTGTQGSAANQLEVAFSRERARIGADTERSRSLPIVFTRGISETLDLSVGFSREWIRSPGTAGDASGAGNPTLGAKWRFHESEAGATSWAIKAEVPLPASVASEGAGLGSGKVSGATTLIVTQTTAFGAIHANLGVARDRYRETSGQANTSTIRASIAPVWDLGEQWKLALDLGVESARAQGATLRSRFVELGVIYSPGKDLDFAVGIVRAFDDQNPRTRTDTVNAGATWRFR